MSTMKRLTVLAYRGDADAIVRRLMDRRCVEVRNTLPDAETLVRLEEDGTRAEAEARLVHIRAALPVLSRYTTRKSGLGRRVQRVNREEFLSSGEGARAYAAVLECERVEARLRELADRRAQCASERGALIPWLEYDAPLNVVGTSHTVTVLGSVQTGKHSEAFLKELEAAGAVYETVYEADKTAYLALTYHRTDEDALRKILAEHGFLAVSFPEVPRTAQAEYDRLELEEQALEDERLRLVDRLTDLSEALDAVEVLSDIEETTLAVCRQKQRLVGTRNCVILDAWVPEKRVESVLATLSHFECASELSDPEEGEEPPILLYNNRFSETFEWVIGMYSYPKYGTYDPTVIMSIFYFLIFGMMFADVGYGLLVTLGCFLGVKLLNPREGMRRMLLMFGYCGISCMLMGVLFGGWFGNLPTAIMNSFIYHAEGVAETTPIGNFFANGLLFNPISSPTAFLVVGLALGEIHLIAGMAIGMVETIKAGKVLEGIFSAVPYWILFAGIDLMAPSAVVDMVVSDPSSVTEATRALLAQLSDVGFYLLFGGLLAILLLKGLGQKTIGGWLVKGLGGLYSLISYASDLLSYSRILALGLVAGVIAQVINMMTGLGASGPLGFVFMLIVMILGHVLNIAINILGTFVHAARLQYIEFFGKFYEDGGEPFSPMLPVETYSEDPTLYSQENE